MTLDCGDSKAQWVELFWHFVIFLQVRGNTQSQISYVLNFDKPWLLSFFQRIGHPVDFLLIFWKVDFSLDELALPWISKRKLCVVSANFKQNCSFHNLFCVLKLVHQFWKRLHVSEPCVNDLSDIILSLQFFLGDSFVYFC